MTDHSTEQAGEATLRIGLNTGDILFLDGMLFGEITSLTDTGLVRYEFPGDGETHGDSIGKASLRQKIQEADEVTIEHA